MKIGKPFKTFINAPYPQGSITQYFGEHPELYGKICPVAGQCLAGHNGIDMVAPWGTPLYAVEDGKVTEAKDSPEGFGLYVRTISYGPDGREWTYGHLSKIAVEENQDIKKGDYIGDMGNTGFVVSSQNANGFWKYNPYLGTHLHLGVRSRPYGRKVLNYGNGYFGCYDFKDMLPDYDPVNDDIGGFVNLLKVLLTKLQQAGISIQRPKDS
jgi:murein DD-endopeptidase MepM/ murein hydrolase activator NlpD